MDVNIGAPQYITQMQTAIKGEIDSNTIIVGDFNTLLSSMDRSSRQKISKETEALKDTLDQTHNSKRYMHPSVHCITIYNSQHMEAT